MTDTGFVERQKARSQTLGEGKKYDSEKDRWDLLNLEDLEGVVKILTFGAKKYSPNNWQMVENGVERYYAALLRHLVAWRKGEYLDSESGLPHVDHAFCNMYFLVHLLKKENDNR
jgi:hypothetical protein